MSFATACLSVSHNDSIVSVDYVLHYRLGYAVVGLVLRRIDVKYVVKEKRPVDFSTFFVWSGKTHIFVVSANFNAITKLPTPLSFVIEKRANPHNHYINVSPFQEITCL